MSSQRIVGGVLVAVGVVLLIVGLNASHSVADRWTNFFTGHFTDSTVWYIGGGVAAIALGVVAAAVGGRKGVV